MRISTASFLSLIVRLAAETTSFSDNSQIIAFNRHILLDIANEQLTWNDDWRWEDFKEAEKQIEAHFPSA